MILAEAQPRYGESSFFLVNGPLNFRLQRKAAPRRSFVWR